jgi:hypothetical protein
MTFLAPWWLGAAALLGGAVVVLHLLARRRPRSFFFPTARFVPDRPATSAALAARPSDLPLLLLRLLLVLLLGAAFAQPVVSSRGRTSRIVLLDQSRLASPLDSGSAQLVGAADAIIAFDTSARQVPSAEDALRLEPTGARGSLSAGLVAAIRLASEQARNRDSLFLTIISPFSVEEFDAATLRIREQWNGGISLVPTPPRVPIEGRIPVALPPDDPLAAALALMEPDGHLPSRLVRGNATALDSAWARGGGTLVIWPRDLAAAGWPPGPGDTAGGVAVDDQAVVAAFPRDFVPPPGTVTAAWADGRPAATTVPAEKGCIRNVAIAVPAAGDLALRESFLRLTRSLLSPCSGWIDPARAPAAWLDSLQGSPGPHSSVITAGDKERETPANRWLLLTAVLVFVSEPLLRRRRAA